MPIVFRFPIALVLLIVCLAAPTWADFQAGEDAYLRGDYATAVHEWRPLAKQGNVLAQYSLGVLYDNGYGVPQDYGQARQWWEQAAAQGNADAQYNLGVLYSNGHGVPQDYGQARQWYEKAAAQGIARAQYSLGALYSNGYGVPQDFVQAHKWYILAGANGNKKAASFRDALAKQMTPAQIGEAQRLAREWKPTMP
jgi:TPR repeat protein